MSAIAFNASLFSSSVAAQQKCLNTPTHIIGATSASANFAVAEQCKFKNDDQFKTVRQIVRVYNTNKPKNIAIPEPPAPVAWAELMKALNINTNFSQNEYETFLCEWFSYWNAYWQNN